MPLTLDSTIPFGFMRRYQAERLLRELSVDFFYEPLARHVPRVLFPRLIERVSADPKWSFTAGNRAIETLGLSPLELPEPGKRNITCLPPLPDSTAAAGLGTVARRGVEAVESV